MRRGQKGRPSNPKLKRRIADLYKVGYSYTEIAEILNMKSRQLAQYHGATAKKFENKD